MASVHWRELPPLTYTCFHKSRTRTMDTSTSANLVISTRPKKHFHLMAGTTNWVLGMDGKFGSTLNYNYWLCESLTCNWGVGSGTVPRNNLTRGYLKSILGSRESFLKKKKRILIYNFHLSVNKSHAIAVSGFLGQPYGRCHRVPRERGQEKCGAPKLQSLKFCCRREERLCAVAGGKCFT